MNITATQGEVLRGMDVEPQPLRVGRVRVAVPIDEPARTEPNDEWPQAIEAERRAARLAGEQAGYAEGLRRGRADAAEEAKAAVQEAIADARAPIAAQTERLVRLVASLEAVRRDLLRLAEEDLVAVCFETVCRTLADTALDPDVVRAQARRAAAGCAAGSKAVLHVHAQDVELLRNTGALQDLECVADPGVALGGCIVRRPGDSLDARLETALAACRDSLLATRARRANAERGA